jgi:hypothetical protein
MADQLPFVVNAVVVEDVQLTFAQLCRACRVDQDQLLALVEEGVLEPMGDEPAECASAARRWAGLAARCVWRTNSSSARTAPRSCWTCWKRSTRCAPGCGKRVWADQGLN